MATCDEGPGRGMALSPPSRVYDEEERAYAGWVRQFLRHFEQRMPGLPRHRVQQVLDRWCVRYCELAPQEAAERAAASLSRHARIGDACEDCPG